MMKLTLKTSFETLRSHPESFLNLYREGVLDMRVARPEPTEIPLPATRDEIHVVAEGSANFCCADATDRVRRGDILFVQCNVEHRFSDFSSDFRTWVFFIPASEPGLNEFGSFSLQAV